MKLWVAGAVLLVAAAYYMYQPLPSGVSDRAHLMVLDVVVRNLMLASEVAQALGLFNWTYVIKKVGTLDLTDARSCPAVHVMDITLGGLPTRVFQAKGGGALKRGVIFFHGGGWLTLSGRHRLYDNLCRRMAKDLDAVIMSVDYHLVPEAVFPDQYNDAVAASRAFLSAQVLERYSIDPERLCVSGDSAGGNLAAAVAQEISLDDSVTVKFKVQALIYPALQALDFQTSSYQQNQAMPLLQRNSMITYWMGYLGASSDLRPLLLANNHSSLDQPAISPDIRSRFDWDSLIPAELKKHYRPVVKKTGSVGVLNELPALIDVRAAPLLAEQRVLAKTPKAYILTCEFDVLRDDGLMYVKRLQDAGVTVTNDHFKDGYHGNIFSAVGDSYIRWLDQNL